MDEGFVRHGVDIERVGYITIPGHLAGQGFTLHLLAQFVLINNTALQQLVSADVIGPHVVVARSGLIIL